MKIKPKNFSVLVKVRPADSENELDESFIKFEKIKKDTAKCDYGLFF